MSAKPFTTSVAVLHGRCDSVWLFALDSSRFHRCSFDQVGNLTLWTSTRSRSDRLRSAQLSIADSSLVQGSRLVAVLQAFQPILCTHGSFLFKVSLGSASPSSLPCLRTCRHISARRKSHTTASPRNTQMLKDCGSSVFSFVAIPACNLLALSACATH